MSPSTTAYSVRGLMSSASNSAPGHHFRPTSGNRPGMFDELRKRAKRQENQREQRIDSLVQEQRERQLRTFRRTGR
jgi:hypothetical protein